MIWPITIPTLTRIIQAQSQGYIMEFILEQAIGTHALMTLVKSTIDTKQDMDIAVDAIKAFDQMLLSVGVFGNTDHTFLVVNGKPIEYAQVLNEEDLLKLLEVYV